MEITTSKDCWTKIKESKKPICMYGMGNGADKIIKVLDSIGVEIDDFFASDGFVRGHSFHGKTVISYSDVCSKYPDFLILLAFGSSLPDMLDRFYALSEKHELLAPDVPVSGGELFNNDFYYLHKKEIDAVYSLLEDDRSKAVFRDVIEFKLSGDIKHLSLESAGREDVFTSILSPESYRNAADLGAYNGDTARELLSYAKNIQKIFALEPDKRSFRKLSAFVEENNLPDIITPVFAAAGQTDGEACFSSEGNRNSSVSEKGKDTVTVRSVDSLAGDIPLDMIKFDIEGAEEEAILGARKQIKEYRPDLIVSLYHKSRDIFALPLLIKELCPEYKFYIRREKYVPAWDVELIATVR